MAQANRERWDLGGTQMETLLTEVARFKGESLWQDAWRRLKANRASWWALVFLAVFGSVSILAPVLPPCLVLLHVRDRVRFLLLLFQLSACPAS